MQNEIVPRQPAPDPPIIVRQEDIIRRTDTAKVILYSCLGLFFVALLVLGGVGYHYYNNPPAWTQEVASKYFSGLTNGLISKTGNVKDKFGRTPATALAYFMDLLKQRKYSENWKMLSRSSQSMFCELLHDNLVKADPARAASYSVEDIRSKIMTDKKNPICKSFWGGFKRSTPYKKIKAEELTVHKVFSSSELIIKSKQNGFAVVLVLEDNVWRIGISETMKLRETASKISHD